MGSTGEHRDVQGRGMEMGSMEMCREEAWSGEHSRRCVEKRHGMGSIEMCKDEAWGGEHRRGKAA